MLSDLQQEGYVSDTLKQLGQAQQQTTAMLQAQNVPGDFEAAKESRIIKMKWLKYAAAAVIVIGLGAYLWNTREGKREKEEGKISSVSIFPNDIKPGGNKAILQLADGKTIVLNDAANGKIAEQGKTEIVKEDGIIIYSKQTTPVSHLPSPSLNTMSTPRGGQYQLTLSDGTKVWLNAESSITYPTAFSGKERRVSITGEAYFEVAKNKSKAIYSRIERCERAGTGYTL